MRFFTDQFFTEEQKQQMLGAAYPKRLAQKILQEQERQFAAYAAQESLRQQAELEEFKRSSRATGGGFFIFILLLSLVNWLTMPYSLDGLI